MEYIFSPEKIRDEVLAFMRDKGMYPARERDTWLILDDRIHRYQIEGHKNGSTNGAYVIHTDGIPAAYIQDWSNPNSRYTWSMKGFKKADFDSTEWNKKRAAREAEEQQKREQAVEDAYALYDKSFNGEIWHAYLDRKDVKAYEGVRLDNPTGHLLIPLRDIGGSFKAVQTIDRDGQKRFFYGTSYKGNFYSIGLDMLREGDGKPIFVCEGYATTAKVFQLTDLPCVAAISCNNLEAVITALRGRYGGRPIILMADNDLATFNKHGFNPGIDEAKKLLAAKLITGYVAPPFNPKDPEGSDWDDYALKFGNDAARDAINQGIADMYREAKRLQYVEQVKKLGYMGGTDFASFCRPPEGESWLIQDWLPAESQLMLFAPSASGKGFLILDIAASIACPNILKWHDFPITKHGDVVYLIGEGQRGMHKRFAGWGDYKNIPRDSVKLFPIPQAVPINDKKPELGIKKIIANIGSLTPDPVLIIIDTTNRFMAGDENSTEDATAYINACAAIAKEFPHASVLTIHHTGQAVETRGRARGSSVFKAAMDMEYTISKSGSVITLEMTKSKDTEEQPPISFRLHSIEVPGYYRSDGSLDTTCILKYDEEITHIKADSYEQPEAKFSKSEKFARYTYAEAAALYGFIITDDNGEEVAALKLEDWRRVFYLKSAADSDNTKRGQFNRARKTLLEESQLLFKTEIEDEECYCLRHEGNAYEAEIIARIKGR